MSPLDTTPQPSDSALREARRIDLSRTPASDSAHALVAAVVDEALAHRDGTRQAGSETRKTWRSNIGVILGGLLREDVVSAQRNNSGAMWKDGLAIGRKAFWSRVEAMERAGLVGTVNGIKTPLLMSPGAFTGLPTKLWATPRLREMAASHRISRSSIKTDWRFSETALHATQEITGDLIVLRPFKVKIGSEWRDDGDYLPIPPHLREEADELRRGVELLNARIAAADIRGTIPPVFRRRFRHDFRFGGRFYTPGTGSFSNMWKTDRQAMTINGEPAVEVDISASQATVFLALTDSERLKEHGGDLYAFDGLPREVVKAFFVQSFGAGRAPSRWSANTSPAVRSVPLKAVRSAVLARYPTMANIAAVLPDGLPDDLTPEQRQRAAGQHVVFRESQVIAGAVERLGEAGVVALPLHDALVVAESAGERATAALEMAFSNQLGATPRLEIKA